MGISASELEVNTKHINELADQIRYNTDCEVLKLVVEEHLDSVRDLFDDIKKEQQKLLAEILPILQIPGANPAAIVGWIQKLVTGLVTPQMRAHIKYAKKMIQLGGAILNVVQAVQEAAKNLPQCAIEIQDQVLAEIENQVNGVIGDALNQIAESQSGLLAIIDAGNTLTQIDTSSPEAFISSVDTAMDAIELKASEFNQTPTPPTT